MLGYRPRAGRACGVLSHTPPLLLLGLEVLILSFSQSHAILKGYVTSEPFI